MFLLLSIQIFWYSTCKSLVRCVIGKILSHSVGGLIIFLMVSSEVFNFDGVQLIYFLLLSVSCVFDIISKKSFPSPRSWGLTYSYVFSQEFWNCSSFYIRSMAYSELTFIYGVRLGIKLLDWGVGRFAFFWGLAPRLADAHLLVVPSHGCFSSKCADFLFLEGHPSFWIRAHQYSLTSLQLLLYRPRLQT